MTPIVHALRCSLVPIVLVAAAIAVMVALWQRPPAQVVVMVPVSISAPATDPVAVPVPVPVPSWCYDGTWRHASVDLRPFCTWR